LINQEATEKQAILKKQLRQDVHNRSIQRQNMFRESAIQEKRIQAQEATQRRHRAEDVAEIKKQRALSKLGQLGGYNESKSEPITKTSPPKTHNLQALSRRPPTPKLI